MPQSRLLHLAGRSVLVLDRFDRTSTGQRIGYVSAMTMLEASDGEQRSYLDIAEVVESSSTRATEELQELWRRIVFTVLISNTDDHLRNHGFLHQRGDAWRLSPAFDLNPDPAPGPKYLATAIDGGDDRASLAAALAVAGHFRLPDAQARSIVRQVAAAVSGWRTTAGRHQLTPSEIAAMEPAFVPASPTPPTCRPSCCEEEEPDAARPASAGCRSWLRAPWRPSTAGSPISVVGRMVHPLEPGCLL